MALNYTEFDSTPQTIINDLKTAITGSSDWSQINSTSVLLTSTAATVVNATSMTFTSGTPATVGIVVGSIIRIGEAGAADAEYRLVTAVAATTVSFAGLLYVHASGTKVYSGNMVLKATTTRGADMIVDLSYGALSLSFLTMAVWQVHDGTIGTNVQSRYLYWKNGNVTSWTNALHVIVSAGKEHLFISIEGPRATEVGTASGIFGSSRNYFFINDMVPYHVSDTNPCVFAGGSAVASINGGYNGQSHVGHLSKNHGGAVAWSPAKLATLTFPGQGLSAAVQMQRQTVGDGNYYLFPYVVCSDTDGVRGRLNSFFFAGVTTTDTPYEVPPPPVGTKITYGGVTYKLLAVNKNDNNSADWQQFGIAAATPPSSVVVAVPCT